MYNNLGNNMTQYKFKTKPFKHQLEAFNLGKDKKEYAYLLKIVTGKQ